MQTQWGPLKCVSLVYFVEIQDLYHQHLGSLRGYFFSLTFLLSSISSDSYLWTTVSAGLSSSLVVCLIIYLSSSGSDLNSFPLKSSMSILEFLLLALLSFQSVTSFSLPNLEVSSSVDANSQVFDSSIINSSINLSRENSNLILASFGMSFLSISLLFFMYRKLSASILRLATAVYFIQNVDQSQGEELDCKQ